MKTVSAFLLAFLIGCATSISTATAKRQIRIAVIDTGFDLTDNRVPLCASGHVDLTGTGIQDKHGHGTNIVGTINRYTSDVPHCFIIIKYFHINPLEDINKAIAYSVQAIEAAIKANADIINYSGGGSGFSIAEKTATLKALDLGIKFVAAAGNNFANLDDNPYYPASYDKRIIVVSAYTLDLRNNRVKPPSSNYGKAVDIFDSFKSETFCPKPSNKLCGYQGTSQATATVTGKLVKCMFNKNSYTEVCKLLK